MSFMSIIRQCCQTKKNPFIHFCSWILVEQRQLFNNRPITKLARHVPEQVSKRTRQDLFINLAYRSRVLTTRQAWIEISNASNRVLQQIKDDHSGYSNLEVLPNLSNDQFMQFVRNIATISQSSIPKYLNKMMENECCARINRLDRVSLLFFADVLFVLKLDLARYLSLAYKSIDARWNDLFFEKEDVLLLSFFMSTGRSSNPSVSLMHKIESYFQTRMDSFSANEIGIVCQAFFSTNTSFRDYSTLEKLSITLLHDMENKNLKLYQLCNILKALRHAQFAKLTFYEKFGELLCKIIQNNRYVNLTELAIISFAYSSLKISHHNLFSVIKQRASDILMKDNVKDFRMKDLSRLVWSLSTVSVSIPEVIYRKLIENMNKNFDLLMQYPEAFVEALISSALNNIYPEDLLDFVFSPKFLNFKSGRLLEQHFQLLLLDTAVKVECCTYHGNHLPKNYLESFPKETFGNLLYELNTRQGLLALINALYGFLGDWSFLHAHFILGHSRITDIELQLDFKGSPVRFNSDHKDVMLVLDTYKSPEGRINQGNGSHQISNIKKLLMEQERQKNGKNDSFKQLHLIPKQDKQKNRKISIKVMGWNQYALNEPVLLGLHQMELRLLTKLGYEVFVVDPIVAERIDGASLDERIQIVKRILKDCNIRFDPSNM